MKVGDGLTVVSSGLKVADGFSVGNGGMKVAGGMSVTSSGLIVDAGGVSIKANGLRVSDSLSVYNAGLFATGGVSVFGGVKVTTGLSVLSGGVYITNGLTVYGNIYFNSVPSTPSDRRLKSEITPIGDSFSKVMKLRGVYYKWQKKESFDVPDLDRHIGLIAQDVQDVFPDLVSTTHGGKYLGVKYTELIPILIEAIRELGERVTVLEGTVAELASDQR